jgi:hypothetical protein
VHLCIFLPESAIMTAGQGCSRRNERESGAGSARVIGGPAAQALKVGWASVLHYFHHLAIMRPGDAKADRDAVGFLGKFGGGHGN